MAKLSPRILQKVSGSGDTKCEDTTSNGSSLSSRIKSPDGFTFSTLSTNKDNVSSNTNENGSEKPGLKTKTRWLALRQQLQNQLPKRTENKTEFHLSLPTSDRTVRSNNVTFRSRCSSSAGNIRRGKSNSKTEETSNDEKQGLSRWRSLSSVSKEQMANWKTVKKGKTQSNMNCFEVVWHLCNIWNPQICKSYRPKATPCPPIRQSKSASQNLDTERRPTIFDIVQILKAKKEE